MVVVGGASPKARLGARGARPAGLGRGEIRSTSATGSGFTIVLDLKEKKKKKKEEKSIITSLVQSR